MATLNNRVFDNGLSVLDLEANEIHVTSQEATDFTGATATYSLGSSSSLSISAPQDRTAGGREVVVASITDGLISANGNVTHYAIVDTVNSRLLATGEITVPQTVTAGNTFTLSSITVGIPDPA